MIHKRVEFKGEVYWLHNSDGGFTMLSPLDHYNDLGELVASPFSDISFAVVINGEIHRFGNIIGKESELKEVLDV